MGEKPLARVGEWAVLLGAALAVALMGAVLLWFLVFSGLAGPVQFAYAAF